MGALPRPFHWFFLPAIPLPTMDAFGGFRGSGVMGMSGGRIPAMQLRKEVFLSVSTKPGSMPRRNIPTQAAFCERLGLYKAVTKALPWGSWLQKCRANQARPGRSRRLFQESLELPASCKDFSGMPSQGSCQSPLPPMPLQPEKHHGGSVEGNLRGTGWSPHHLYPLSLPPSSLPTDQSCSTY